MPENRLINSEFGYDLMADDVVALMDVLEVPKADIVGWSDGAILGLDLAMRHPDRVGKIFAFAANTVTSGVKDGVEKNPTFAALIKRAGREYEAYSATPKEYDAFVEQISKMWASQQDSFEPQIFAIFARLCAKVLRPGGRKGIGTEGRNDHEDPMVVDQQGQPLLPSVQVQPGFGMIDVALNAA